MPRRGQDDRRGKDDNLSSQTQEIELHARFLELDVREAHVEEKVNALETMKMLLTSGSANEQRLREAMRQLEEHNHMELMLVQEESRTRESSINDKLIRAEIEIQRLGSEVTYILQFKDTCRYIC